MPASGGTEGGSLPPGRLTVALALGLATDADGAALSVGIADGSALFSVTTGVLIDPLVVALRGGSPVAAFSVCASEMRAAGLLAQGAPNTKRAPPSTTTQVTTDANINRRSCRFGS